MRWVWGLDATQATYNLCFVVTNKSWQEAQSIGKPSFPDNLNTLACKDTHAWLHIMFTLRATCLSWSYSLVKSHDYNVNKMEHKEGGLSPVVTWVFADMEVCVYDCFLLPAPCLYENSWPCCALPDYKVISSRLIQVLLLNHHILLATTPPHLPRQTHCHLE